MTPPITTEKPAAIPKRVVLPPAKRPRGYDELITVGRHHRSSLRGRMIMDSLEHGVAHARDEIGGY